MIDSDDEADLSLAQLRRAFSHPDEYPMNENDMRIHFALPWWDLTDKGTVFSITKEVRNKLGTLGVMGLDLRIEEITDDFSDFDPANPLSYAFLIDLEGYVFSYYFI